MIKSCRRIFFVALTLLAAVQIQNFTPPVNSQQGSIEDADDVVRITTNLVQIDAVVTDKHENVITDLRQQDFEVFEDDRQQQVQNFSFVPLEPDGATRSYDRSPSLIASVGNVLPPPPVAPPARLRPEQVRNTIALVPGNLSFGSTDAVHDALKKYVAEQVRANDLVAVIPLSGSHSALQGFTTDRRQLARAVEKVRWLPASGDDVDTVEAARSDHTFKMTPTGAGAFESREARETRERIENTVGGRCRRETLNIAALTNIVRSTSYLPGRKSVVFFSDGVSINRGEGDLSLCVYNALRRLVDAAARSAVVIYAIDARGVVNQYHISAQDDVLPENTSSLRSARARGFFESQNGLNFMAENTGGRFIHSNNNLNQALKRVMDDQRRSYYLIGYRPSAETFKGTKFHDIKVRVRNRPELKVRSRKGFYSLPDGEAKPRPSGSGDRQLIAALASPVGGADVRIQLTSLFGNDPRAGSFVRSLLHINAQDITFADEPNNFKKAVLDVAAVTFGEDGRIADEFNRTHTVRIGPDTFQHIMLHGLSYSADVPVKQAGAYQLRIVVRDAASGRLGASGQFVEVPDVGRRKQFALSGLVLGEAAANGSPTLPPAATAEAALAPVSSPSHLALRHFRPGAALAYSYVVFNPHLERADARPRLTARARLFRKGNEFLTTPETSLDASAQTDASRVNAGGTLILPRDTPPGSYILQVVVNDVTPGKRRQFLTQWTDLEIVK